ncbi:MAG: SUMF1/EgtB/PvdO family nonheme iron enzyme [Candidatus Latescibacteria bacterium]|nr:SUMF1/EgtB/PvdO family nonheme iron enzyme [Candidatus Latescibacterota bacterium]
MNNRFFVTAIIIITILTIITILPQNALTTGHWDREPGYKHPVITTPYTPKPFKPRQYVACRTIDTITLDGKINESSWDNAEWTEKFVHIVFEGYKNPNLATRAKMVWDDANIYFAGELEEPNIYGHLTKKDTVICRESDFEIFIDVDGDTRNYIEIEFNALGTVWDMIYDKELDKGSFPKSYPMIPGTEPWDVEGMRIAVRTDGTVNYPYDVDEGWSFECKIPWESLEKTNLSGQKLNKNGTVMRIDFSRVEFTIKEQWPIEDWTPIEGVDWLWTPMLSYRAHVTETFGRVILSDRTVIQSKDCELEQAFPFSEPPKPPKNPNVGGMVKIKGGTYTVGPDDDDPSGASPRGEVTVDDFYIDRYEVTINEYTKFLNAGDHDDFYWEDMANPDWCGIIKLDDGSYEVVPGKDLYPVVLLKIDGAKAYAEWAGKRLPTEYEWEIAARGGTDRLYPWGNEPLDESRANYDYHIGHTVPVGSYPNGRTPEGLYDMAGNVNEMIDKVWEEYPWGKMHKFENRRARKICRGGAWTAQPLKLKTTHRDVVKSHEMAPFVGFRCAKDAK